MKMRVPLLLLLVVGGGLLVWFLGSVRGAPQPRQPYWSRQIDDLSALGRYKHAAAAEYAHYASAAEAEGHPAAARLFHALADSHQVHEMNCADAVRRLGGRYTPPSRVLVFRRATAANLTAALDGETHHYDRYRSGLIDSALSAGNRYAARILIRIAGCDMRHTELLDCFVLRRGSEGYAVCPVCGNVCSTARCDYYCPLCQTPDSEFIRYD